MRKTSRPGHREAATPRRRWPRERMMTMRKTNRPGHGEVLMMRRRQPRRRWPRRRMTTMRKTSKPGHQEVATTTALSAPSNFPESCIG
jgi:hypothetical protein